MDTVIKIKLKPIWHIDPPKFRIDWDGDWLFDDKIEKEQEFTFRVEGKAGRHELGFTLLNKNDNDTVTKGKEIIKDKAVSIESILIEGFEFDSFMHSIEYKDQYKRKKKKYGNYVCWNQRWVLPMEFPIFTWIHKLENLVWIYGDTI